MPKPSTHPIFDHLQCIKIIVRGSVRTMILILVVYKAGNEAMHAAIAHYYIC